MKQENRIIQDGFTLLEVMVAFALLTLLLTVIIQSQAEINYFLRKTSKLALVHKEVINELLRIERSFSGEMIESGEGTFDAEHVLAGNKWQKVVTQENFMGIVPVMKVTYRIIWIPPDGTGERMFESSILGEVK